MAELNYKKGFKRIACTVRLITLIVGIICMFCGFYLLLVKFPIYGGGRLLGYCAALIFIPLTVFLYYWLAWALFRKKIDTGRHYIIFWLFLILGAVGLSMVLTSAVFLPGDTENDMMLAGQGIVGASLFLYIFLYIVYGIVMFFVRGFQDSETKSS